MRVMTLLRVAEFPSYGTFGVLMDEGLPICLTLERIWKNNKKNESCIPEGEYITERSWYNKGGYATFEVKCPPREQIKFHKGNIDEDSHGCILLGESYDPVWNVGSYGLDYGILASGKAFHQFMDILKGMDAFKLIVTRWRMT